LTVKTFKGWGTTEIEVVKEETDIDSKGEKIPINHLVIDKKNIYSKEPTCDLESMTFRKYMKEIDNKSYLYFILDEINNPDEKERLLEIAGGKEFVKHSKNYRHLNVKNEEKWTISIKMHHLSIEELKKLIEKKINMRDIYGDDYMYKEFLYKRHGVKKIGGPKYEEEKEVFGEKFLDSFT
jgi:hypothetical protein